MRTNDASSLVRFTLDLTFAKREFLCEHTFHTLDEGVVLFLSTTFVENNLRQRQQHQIRRGSGLGYERGTANCAIILSERDAPPNYGSPEELKADWNMEPNIDLILDIPVARNKVHL